MSLLTLSKVSASYGVSQALFGVSLKLSEGKVMALMGRNGMGKSTTVKCICRMLPAQGQIVFDGHDLARLPSHRAARLGIGLVPEGRRCFASLTVEENLVAAARKGHWDMSRVTALFPRLAERKDQRAASLSGGEQQMLAIARALMSEPTLLLLDEPSLGLAPLIVRQIFDVIRDINQSSGMTVFLVEQNAFHALRLADRGYVMVNGEISMTGSGKDLLNDPEVQRAYLEGAVG